MKGLSYDIRLFGPPLFPDNVGTSRKIRNKTIAFIAYLAYETRPISRDFLATLLWPFSGQSAARGNLRTVIHDAAKVLPQNAILSNSDTLQLSREHVSIDLWHFSDAVACLSEAPPPLDRLLAATEVCRGDFLEGFTLPDCSEFDSWQLLATDSIRSQLAFVLNGIVTARIKSGEVEKAVEPASRLVSLDPLEESSHRLMMEVYARCGRWAAAIGQYETCVRILADELDCEPDDETIRLVKEVRDRSKRFSEIRPESHFVMGRHQRPLVPSNRFFGRKHALEKIAGSLRSGTRLITVTGPAGIGKTRFAIEAIRVLDPSFIETAVFVDLTKIVDPAEVFPLIAHAIGLQRRYPTQSELASALEEQLNCRRMLILLDNFEHVIQAASGVNDFIQATEVVQLLVTSREPLHIQEEETIRLNPLDISPLLSFTSIANSEAVQLFVERVRARIPDFTVTEENYKSIQSICLSLECIPLALELGAPLLQLYPPEELPAKLEHSLKYLSGDSRDTNDRHRTLEMAIDWSYNLLAAEEKALLLKLSVFADGFDTVAAESVCGNESDVHFQEIFLSLVEKSLISTSRATKWRRFRLLQATREYAAAKRVELLEFNALSERHAFYYCDLAQAAEPKLHGRDQMLWIDRLEADHANILLAFSYLCDHGHVDAAMKMAVSLNWFWFRRGFFQLGRERLRKVIALCESQQSLIFARALHSLGWLTFIAGDWREAHSLYGRSLYLARQLDDRTCESYALADLGVTERWLGDVESGTKCCLAAVTTARETGSAQLLNRALIWSYATTGGDFDWCYPESELKEAASLSASTGDAWMLAHSHAGLGDLYSKHRYFTKARASFDEALQGFAKLDDRFLSAWTLDGLGRVEEECGNAGAAMEYTQRAIDLFDQLGDELNVGLMIDRLVGTVREADTGNKLAMIAGAASKMINGRRRDDLSKAPQIEEAAKQIAGLDIEFPSEWIRGMSLSRAEAVDWIRRYITSS